MPTFPAAILIKALVKDIEKRGIAGIRSFSPRSMVRRRLLLTTRLQQNTFGEHGVPIICHVTALKKEVELYCYFSWLKLVWDSA